MSNRIKRVPVTVAAKAVRAFMRRFEKVPKDMKKAGCSPEEIAAMEQLIADAFSEAGKIKIGEDDTLEGLLRLGLHDEAERN